MEIRVTLRQEEDGRWVGVVPDGQPVPGLLTKGPSRDECLDKVRRALERSLSEQDTDGPLTLVVESIPRLAGVAEAAEVMGWDKRRVVTYISRGRFPEPIQALASGRVWARSTLEDFARVWNERQAKRKRRQADGPQETPDERPPEAQP
jgi:predicted RNase H-like HicB family nuclease